MFIRNAWYVAGWSSEFPSDGITSRTLLNEPIAIYRKRDGSVVALADRCVHRLAPLSLGSREGDDLRCGYHGLKFAPSGKCIEIPGLEGRIPERARVLSYPAVDRHSWVWVWPGDPALADESLIPPAIGLDHPDWTLKTGELDYEASHQLVNDNLLDFSHLSYVHKVSFGASEKWALTRPKVTMLERGVRVQRWIEDAPRRNFATNVDTWSSYDFLVPGVLLLSSKVYPPGTAAACNHEPPTIAPLPHAVSDTFSSQAVTPLTDTTSRYFFSWGPPTGEGAEATAQMLLGIAHQAFAEDKAMIEAQQKVVARSPGVSVMPTPNDHAVLAFQRLMNKMMQAEGGRGVPISKSLSSV
jgi:phenylpropionate dioxygenase-like ring-hydroxylating dioxygenase large terminal subunit